MRAANSRVITGSTAASPPSRKTAPHTASRASARIDWRRKPPLLSSPDPRCRVSPRPSVSATSASGSRLTTLARRRLRSPSAACGKAAYRWCAMTRLRTASPRNSSRSLLGPEALRWVRAVRNSDRSRGWGPPRSCTQRPGQSALVMSRGSASSRMGAPLVVTAVTGAHDLVEGDVQRYVSEQRRFIVVPGLDYPRRPLAPHLDVLDGGKLDHVDLKVPVDRVTDRRRIAAAPGVVNRPHHLHVVQIQRRQADAGVAHDRKRREQNQPADCGDTLLSVAHRC